MSDYTLGKQAVEGNVYKLGAYGIESFVNAIIELRDQGYEIREGEFFSSLTGYSVMMDGPGATEEILVETPVEEPEKIVGTINMGVSEADFAKDQVQPVYSAEYVVSIEGDKSALAEYAQTFNVVLKKNKSFENMVKDLEEAVK